MPQVIITLRVVACARPQEGRTDEIYVRYAFREKGDSPTFHRKPDPDAWTFARGQRDNPDLVLVATAVLPDRVYTFDLELWEEDFSAPSGPAARRIIQGAGTAVRSLGLWNLVPFSSITAVFVGAVAAFVDPDDRLGGHQIDVYVPPLVPTLDGLGLPPGFVTPSGHLLHVRTRDYEYHVMYTVLITP